MRSLSIRQKLALELARPLHRELAEEHVLRDLFWECTLRCSLRCRHCGSDCHTTASVKDMPFEDFARVLRRISEKYDPHKVFVIVTGGEPLMRPDIASCGRAIYDMGFPWGIVTNGMLLDRRRFDSLLKAGIHSATISVDGFEADHDWMRGVPGSFRKATEGVRMFTEVDDVIFDVVTCANRRNLASLPEFKEFLISLGLKRWRIFTVFPSGRAAGDPEMQLSPEQFDSLMEFIMETRKEGRIHLNYGCENFLGGYEGLVRDNFFSCSAGLSCSSILANGDIAACASIRSDYAQGNIYRGDDFRYSGTAAGCGSAEMNAAAASISGTVSEARCICVSPTALSVRAHAGCFSKSENDSGYLFRPVDDVGRGVGGKLLPGAAAPSDGNGFEAGVGGGLHVHTGVSDVQDGRAFVGEIPSGTVYSGAMYPRLAEDVPYYHRLRLAGHSFSLSEYSAERYFRKKMLHELDGRRVVFVRGHGDLDTVAADSGQKLRDAVERAGGIGAVFIVIGQEQVPDAQDLILTAGIFRQGAFKELVDAVADVGGYLLLAVDGVTAGGKGLVGGRGDVGDGVQQCAVKVQDN